MNPSYKNNISFEESLKKAYTKKIDSSENGTFKQSGENYKDIKQYFGIMRGKLGTMEEIVIEITEGRRERYIT